MVSKILMLKILSTKVTDHIVWTGLLVETIL